MNSTDPELKAMSAACSNCEEPASSGDGQSMPATPFAQLALILGCAFYLYANLFTLRGVPFLLGGDQVMFWTYAQRMFFGQRVYLDFFEFTPPGTDLVYLSAFRLFGPRVWTTNLIVLLIGVALTWLCFRLALHIMPRPRASLAAALFAVLIYGKLLNGTHHWFCQVALLSAVLVLLRRRSLARIAIAGGLFGVAAFFTQTTGVFAAAAVVLFFFWERSATHSPLRIVLRQCAVLVLGFGAAWGAASAHWLATVGIRRLIYFQVVFPARFMVDRWSVWSLGLPSLHAPGQFANLTQILFVYLLLPVAYLICGFLLWRRRSTSFPSGAQIALLTFVGLATLLEVARSPSWLRLYCAAAPGFILFVWLLSYTGKLQSFITMFLWIALVCAAISQTRSRYRELSVIAHTPAGVVATRPSTKDELFWIAAHTRPGDLFFQAGWTSLYLPLALRHPAFFDMLENRDTTPPEYVELTVRQLETENVQYILWSPTLNTSNPVAGPQAYHLAPFVQFLHQRYHLVWTFTDLNQVWERN